MNFSEETNLPRTNFAALRVKRDVFERSSFGALYLGKTPAEEGDSNHVAAVDGNFALGESFTLLGFAAKSFTPGLASSSHALNVDAAMNNEQGTQRYPRIAGRCGGPEPDALLSALVRVPLKYRQLTAAQPAGRE